MSKPESETDPWSKVEDYLLDGPAWAAQHGLRLKLAQSIGTARAAEAAQHQQEIDIAHGALLGVEQAVLGFERAGDDPDGAIAMALIAKQEATDLHARLAAVEAERDKQAEQIAMLLTICPNCAGLMAPEPPDSGCSGVYCPECRSDSAELRAERDRLKAALQGVTSTQRGYLCWCDNSWNAVEHGHQPKCTAASAALTPQHQPSTDGETK